MEAFKLLLGAANADTNRAIIVQTEHTHKTFSVDLLLFVTYQHIKGLHHGEGYKIPNLAEGTDPDVKLMHVHAPQSNTKALET